MFEAGHDGRGLAAVAPQSQNPPVARFVGHGSIAVARRVNEFETIGKLSNFCACQGPENTATSQMDNTSPNAATAMRMERGP